MTANLPRADLRTVSEVRSSVRRDGRGQFLDAVGSAGPADVGLGRNELVECNSRHKNLLR